MHVPMIMGELELSYLRRFWAGVDRAIAAEMKSGDRVSEENLTFLLGRLLDGGSTLQEMLEYRLDNLNRDLEQCGTGCQIDIEFTTNEHTKDFEAHVSFADLGIVLRQEHSPIAPGRTKAILVQSKKLYPSREGDYAMHASYGGFNPDQFRNLRKRAEEYDWDGIVYFLYNPLLAAFREDDARVLRAAESRLLDGPWNAWGNWRHFPFHPEEWLHICARFGLPLRSHPTGTPEEMCSARAGQVANRPGVRVLGLRDMNSLVSGSGKEDAVRDSFRLSECYEHAFSGWRRGAQVPFVPLSEYIVNIFMSCAHGTDNPHMIRIAEGQLPERRPKERDDDAPGIAVRHTLKITVRSTLPDQDINLFGSE